MRLKPRHYILLVVLLALAGYNYVRREHAHRAAFNTFSGPETPAWKAFDATAALRDAPDGQFSPAFEALRKQADAATGPDTSDLRNCQMWLQYYRHSAPAEAGNASTWAMLATSHVQSCMSEHRDLGR